MCECGCRFFLQPPLILHRSAFTGVFLYSRKCISSFLVADRRAAVETDRDRSEGVIDASIFVLWRTGCYHLNILLDPAGQNGAGNVNFLRDAHGI